MLHLQSEGLLDLPVLELHSGVLVVAVAVVLGEDGESRLVLVLGDKVTRRLRDPVNESKLDNRRQGLEQGRDSPGPLVAEVVGTEGDPCDDWQGRVNTISSFDGV
jgi:hypothetical protein